MRKKLGECLVQAGLITEEELRAALAEQKQTRDPLGVILTRKGITTESQIAQTVALQLGLPFVNVSTHEPNPATLYLIPQAVALDHASVALTLQRHVLTVAMADPLLLGFVHNLESRTGYRVRQVVASRRDIVEFITRAYSSLPQDSLPVAAPADSDQDEPFDVDAELAAVVQQMHEPGITEMRLEPVDGGGLISRRVDGALRPVARFSRDASEALLAQLKRRACMDPAQRVLPQDGRLKLTGLRGDTRTIHVATRRVPSGELAVLRSHGRSIVLPLASIGLSSSALDGIRALATGSGLLLLSAPAANGASTTAHSIGEATDGRATLFGDIDDTESAGAALAAAREGNLIVATIHADDTAAAVERVVGLSWSPGLVAEVLIGVVSQRLFRRLCDRCRKPSTASEGYEAAGCVQCAYAGYRGRIGILEVLAVANQHRHLIAQGGAAFRAASIADGAASLAEDGLSKVRAGVVTFAELSGSVPGLASARSTCPACGSVVHEDQADCGYCRHRLLGTCLACGKALKPEWGSCPYCTRSVTPGTLLERLS